MAEFRSDILTPETGARLREARIAKGLSEAEVAAKLRINPHYVERMDAGDLRSLPPEPYRKAFIKEYARIVGIKLDSLGGVTQPEQKPEGLLGAVSAVPEVARKVTQEAATIAQSTIKTTETVVKKTSEGVKDAVDEIRAKELWQEAKQVRRERLGLREDDEESAELKVRSAPARPPREQATVARTPSVQQPLPKLGRTEEPTETRRAPSQRLDLDKEVRQEALKYQPPEIPDYGNRNGMSSTTKVIIVLLVIIASIVGYSIVSHRSNAPVTSPVITEIPKMKPIPEVKKAPVPEPKKADTVAVAVAPVLLKDTVLTFSIKAKEAVWVSVTPDVGSGFRGTIKAGEVKQFSAKEKYIVFIGNQHSVDMKLNGRQLSGLPTVPGSNMVVRNVLLTKDKAVPAPSEQSASQIKKAAATRNSVKTHPQKVTTPRKQSKTSAKKAIKPTRSAQKKKSKEQPIKKTIPTTPPVLPRAN